MAATAGTANEAYSTSDGCMPAAAAAAAAAGPASWRPPAAACCARKRRRWRLSVTKMYQVGARKPNSSRLRSGWERRGGAGRWAAAPSTLLTSRRRRVCRRRQCSPLPLPPNAHCGLVGQAELRASCRHAVTCHVCTAARRQPLLQALAVFKGCRYAAHAGCAHCLCRPGRRCQHCGAAAASGGRGVEEAGQGCQQARWATQQAGGQQRIRVLDGHVAGAERAIEVQQYQRELRLQGEGKAAGREEGRGRTSSRWRGRKRDDRTEQKAHCCPAGRHVRTTNRSRQCAQRCRTGRAGCPRVRRRAARRRRFQSEARRPSALGDVGGQGRGGGLSEGSDGQAFKPRGGEACNHPAKHKQTNCTRRPRGTTGSLQSAAQQAAAQRYTDKPGADPPSRGSPLPETWTGPLHFLGWGLQGGRRSHPPMRFA